MKLDICYGTKKLSLEVPRNTIDILSLPQPEQKNEKEIIISAIKNANISLDQFIGASRSVTIVVSDQTRNTGSTIYIPIILEMLKQKDVAVSIIIAHGLHRPATHEELQKIIGTSLNQSIKVINKNPESNLKNYSSGTFSTAVVDAERIILTGSVTFHPMAGYSGGWKSILPGVASKQSIIQNHQLYFSGNNTHPGVGPAQISNNPVLQDIIAKTKVFNEKTWCLNVVQDESKKIIHAAAGKTDVAWESCVSYLNKNNTIPITRKYPIVIASAGGYPSDFSFYQSMKTLTNASKACESGGKILLFMECRNGWELSKDIRSLASMDIQEIAKQVQNNFTIRGLATYMAQSIIKKYDVYCYSLLPSSEVKHFGMNPIISIKSIIKFLEFNNNFDIAFMPAASSVLPIFSKRDDSRGVR